MRVTTCIIATLVMLCGCNASDFDGGVYYYELPPCQPLLVMSPQGYWQPNPLFHGSVSRGECFRREW